MSDARALPSVLVPTAREVAEGHARDLVDGNRERAMRDFYGNALTKLIEAGAVLPDPLTGWEIVFERLSVEHVTLHVGYADDTSTLDLDSRWPQIAGQWRLVEARTVER